MSEDNNIQNTQNNLNVYFYGLEGKFIKDLFFICNKYRIKRIIDIRSPLSILATSWLNYDLHKDILYPKCQINGLTYIYVGDYFSVCGMSNSSYVSLDYVNLQNIKERRFFNITMETMVESIKLYPKDNMLILCDEGHYTKCPKMTKIVDFLRNRKIENINLDLFQIDKKYNSCNINVEEQPKIFENNIIKLDFVNKKVIDK
jgi:hypothetical protein